MQETFKLVSRAARRGVCFDFLSPDAARSVRRFH